MIKSFLDKVVSLLLSDIKTIRWKVDGSENKILKNCVFKDSQSGRLYQLKEVCWSIDYIILEDIKTKTHKMVDCIGLVLKNKHKEIKIAFYKNGELYGI